MCVAHMSELDQIGCWPSYKEQCFVITTFSSHLAEIVLLIFRDRFISEMDTNAIDMELLHKGIIDKGDQRGIAMELNPDKKNQILHECLLKKCTNDALKTVCDVIIGVAGNPKMTALGKDMMNRLEAGKWCLCLFSSCECALTASYATCYFVVYFNLILMQPHLTSYVLLLNHSH